MRLKESVIFFMTNPPHLPYLVVALNTLRRHYSGHIIVFGWPDSFDILKEIERSNFSIEIRKWEPTYKGKNAQEIEKIKAIQTLKGEIEICLYLDADLIIAGPLQLLFNRAAISGFCATQFCDWRMSMGIPRKRLQRMIGRNVDQQLVYEALQANQPAFNSGIFSTRPESPLLPTWGDWTYIVKDIFISGETALHPAVCKYAPKGEATVILGGKFNCSTMRFQPKSLPDNEVIIWHFHGDSCVRPSKSMKGLKMWWAEYAKARDCNLAGIADWAKGCDNEYLNALGDNPI